MHHFVVIGRQNHVADGGSGRDGRTHLVGVFPQARAQVGIESDDLAMIARGRHRRALRRASGGIENGDGDPGEIGDVGRLQGPRERGGVLGQLPRGRGPRQ